MDAITNLEIKRPVCKGYFVARKITDSYQTREKAISRLFHVRDAAVEFARIANQGIDADDKQRAYVREKWGKE